MEEKISKEKVKEEELKKMNNTKKEKTKKVEDKPNEEQKDKENENSSNRLVDVIGKMEEETKKVQIKNKKEIENKSLPTLKKTKNEIVMPINELEKIEKEIRNETIIPKEKKSELYKKIFANIILAIIIVIYLIIIIVCHKLIKKEIFEIILKTSSMSFIICTICIFEYAYKKESIKYTIKGIEMLALAISVLIAMQIYKVYSNNFMNWISIMAVVFSIYYIIKSIKEYIKYKKEIKNEANNIYRTTKRNEGK